MTRARITLSIPPELAAAVRRKSAESGLAISFVVQRALAHWIATGEIAPVSPITSKGKPKK